MNIRPDINLIERVAAMLRDMLGEDFDEETFLDTLDGETDAMDIIGRLIRDREEAKAHAAASKALADEYAQRRSRLDARAQAMAKAIGEILDATGQKKIAHPLGTVSRTAGRMSCKITDEAAIPSQLTVTKVSPDTAAIKKHLEDGETVPGAELVRGPDGVMVRVK